MITITTVVTELTKEKNAMLNTKPAVQTNSLAKTSNAFANNTVAMVRMIVVIIQTKLDVVSTDNSTTIHNCNAFCMNR